MRPSAKEVDVCRLSTESGRRSLYPSRSGGTAGFTLLEMMLTVFLIGLTVSLVAVRIGQDNDDIAKLEAKRFAALVSHLQDEATIIGLPMGVEVSVLENRYRFWLLEDSWKLVDREQALRERQVPDEITIAFSLLQQANQEEPEEEDDLSQNPQDGSGIRPLSVPKNMLVVEPSGLISPFIVAFRGDSMDFRVALDNQLNTVISDEEI